MQSASHMRFFQYKKTLLMCTILSYACVIPQICLAEANNAPPPKHIKMLDKNTTTNKINIISGNYQQKKQEIAQEYSKIAPSTAEIQAITPVKKFKHININDKVNIATCPFNIGNDTLSAKHLAGSLRYYLKTQDINPQSINAIYEASLKTGTDFGVLALSAMLESDFGGNKFSPTSSARGLFQFIDSTWLILVKKYGNKADLIKEANAIHMNSKTGKLEVKESDTISRNSILELRHNDKIASLIKAYHLLEEKEALEEIGIKNPHVTDFYLVHMLGTGLAKKLYALKNKESGEQLAMSESGFRSAADLNPYFFFASAKDQPLTAGQAYTRFYSHVMQAIFKLREIEDEHGIGKDIDLFRPPCD